MPKSTDLAAYPRSYLELVQYFFSGDEKPEMVLSFLTHAAAMAYRFDLYAFRKALDIEGHPLAREAKSLRMRINPEVNGGYQLTIGPVQSRDDPIQAALTSLGVQTLAIVPPLPSEEQSELELAAEHDETDEQLTTADEQADLIANFFKDK